MARWTADLRLPAHLHHSWLCCSNRKAFNPTNTCTLQGINPTLGKGKSSSKCHFWWDMLIPRRVYISHFLDNDFVQRKIRWKYLSNLNTGNDTSPNLNLRHPVWNSLLQFDVKAVLQINLRQWSKCYASKKVMQKMEIAWESISKSNDETYTMHMQDTSSCLAIPPPRQRLFTKSTLQKYRSSLCGLVVTRHSNDLSKHPWNPFYMPLSAQLTHVTTHSNSSGFQCW